jgi:FtsZ-interacting cell division protein ZipA
MDHTTVLIVVIAIALVAIAIAAWIVYQKTRTTRLRGRFGPEYDRAVTDAGSRRKAEDELEARRKRVAKLTLVPLTPEQQNRFGKEWAAAQALFVDDPRGAVADANRLIKEVMQARGYPVGDFDQRAADISVDHPLVVSNYRSAREIALRAESGKASTEDLRRAVVFYRDLFQELLATPGVVEVAR